jgi:hypothetical protein
MKGHVALVREQDTRFAVVVVRPSVMSGLRTERDDAVRAFTDEFGVPAVLMMRDSRGTPTYYGRQDLVRALANVCLDQLPWREFTMRAA